MRIVIDENQGSRRLAARLHSAGHEVVLAIDVGLTSVSDARALAWAVAQRRCVLTRDHGDFADLHDLVAVVGGEHSGILVVRFDNDPRHNLSERGIVAAIANLEASGISPHNTIHVLNHWR